MHGTNHCILEAITALEHKKHCIKDITSNKLQPVCLIVDVTYLPFLWTRTSLSPLQSLGGTVLTASRKSKSPRFVRNQNVDIASTFTRKHINTGNLELLREAHKI